MAVVSSQYLCSHNSDLCSAAAHCSVCMQCFGGLQFCGRLPCSINFFTDNVLLSEVGLGSFTPIC